MTAKAKIRRYKLTICNRQKMKIKFNVALLSLITMLTSCGHRKEISLLSIEVYPDSFMVDGREFRTAAELTTALAEYPLPSGIELKNQPGVTRGVSMRLSRPYTKQK